MECNSRLASLIVKLYPRYDYSFYDLPAAHIEGVFLDIIGYADNMSFLHPGCKGDLLDEVFQVGGIIRHRPQIGIRDHRQVKRWHEPVIELLHGFRSHHVARDEHLERLVQQIWVASIKDDLA